MSFLKGLPITGGIGAALNPTAAAEGLGHLLGASPFGISKFADTVGKISNGIAGAGGASAGYEDPQAVNNHLQLLAPATLQAIMKQFGGAPMGSQFGSAPMGSQFGGAQTGAYPR